jgi:hypothetical protein
MGDTFGVLSFPMILSAAVLLSWRWPGVMRRVARSFAAVTIAALLCIIVTGWGHRHELAAPIHRWLPHGLFILAWSAVPFAVGVTMASLRRPVVATVRAFALLALLGVLFLASVTGYLGPSRGPIDALRLQRFQVFHYWVLPSLAMALALAWYYGLGPNRGTSPGDALEPTASA